MSHMLFSEDGLGGRGGMLFSPQGHGYSSFQSSSVAIALKDTQ